jgi:hypothetical protein
VSALEDAAKRWVRARYLMLRPWLHPDQNLGVEAVLEAEDALLRALVGETDAKGHALLVEAERFSGGPVWAGDEPKSTTKGRAAKAPGARPRRQRRELFE